MKNSILLVLLLPVLLLVFTGCEKDEEEVNTLQVNFIFSHVVDGEDLSFDEVKYTNAAGNNFSVETLKYFVSNITLFQENGSQIFFNSEHYMDARDSSTLFLSAAGIPLANYTKLAFVFGLDETKNVSGRFPNAPESNMEWPPALGGGYHYMKLEGKFDSASTTKNYQCHTGPTMGNQYYVEVELEQGSFTCNNCQSVDVEIIMDIKNWWESPNTLDLNDMSMIMGNEDMQEKLQQNGDNVFSLQLSK